MKRQAPLPKTQLEADLESLPDMPRSNPRAWTRLQDDMILKYVPIKGAPAVASILRIPIQTIRNRFYKLRDGGK
jgi:hypothetical protein